MGQKRPRKKGKEKRRKGKKKRKRKGRGTQIQCILTQAAPKSQIAEKRRATRCMPHETTANTGAREGATSALHGLEHLFHVKQFLPMPAQKTNNPGHLHD